MAKRSKPPAQLVDDEVERQVNEFLDELVPTVLASARRRQGLWPKVEKLVDQAITSGDTKALKDLVPMLALLAKEDKQLLDRRMGQAVQRQEVQVDQVIEQRVIHTSLPELLAQRRERPMIEAEVVRDESN
jgi:hypothetical protein